MIGNAVLWCSLIWMPIILYLMLRNETKFKKNIAVVVTFPFEGRKHPDVIARLEKFKKDELLLCIALMVLGVPGIFLDFRLSFTLWFVWMLLCITLPYVLYVLCNRDLKRIKVEHGWKQAAAADVVTVDLCALPAAKWMSPWAFAVPAALAVAPIFIEPTMYFMYLLDTAMVLLCWLGYRYLFRNKSEQVDDNTTVTVALTRIRRCQWGKMWLLCAYSCAVMNWLAAMTLYNEAAMTIGLVVFMFVIVGVSFAIEFKTRRLQEKLTADSGKDFYVDDDDKWIGGLFYYNPNDDRLVINDRVGTNSSVNLAKPAGKVLYGFLVLLLVSMPLWGLLMGNGEIHTDITNEYVYIEGKPHKYTIETDDVVSVQLLEELPAISRTGGTGLPEFLGGNFMSKEYGKLKVCLNPTVGPYVLVETPDTTYLLGTNDEQQTVAIYNALK